MKESKFVRCLQCGEVLKFTMIKTDKFGVNVAMVHNGEDKHTLTLYRYGNTEEVGTPTLEIRCSNCKRGCVNKEDYEALVDDCRHEVRFMDFSDPDYSPYPEVKVMARLMRSKRNAEDKNKMC